MSTLGRNNGHCEKCGTWRYSLHHDHIVPKRKCRELGWTIEQQEDPSNIQRLCANCHEDKTREDLTGIKLTKEHRIAIGDAHLGKKHSLEHTAKQAATQRGKHKRSGDTKLQKLATRLGFSSIIELDAAILTHITLTSSIKETANLLHCNYGVVKRRLWRNNFGPVTRRYKVEGDQL
jgi:hypothetical protein